MSDPRVQVRWLASDWKKHQRTFNDYRRERIVLNPVCDKCKSSVTVESTAGGTTTILRCDCTDRVITQGV